MERRLFGVFLPRESRKQIKLPDCSLDLLHCSYTLVMSRWHQQQSASPSLQPPGSTFCSAIHRGPNRERMRIQTLIRKQKKHTRLQNNGEVLGKMLRTREMNTLNMKCVLVSQHSLDHFSFSSNIKQELEPTQLLLFIINCASETSMMLIWIIDGATAFESFLLELCLRAHGQVDYPQLC